MRIEPVTDIKYVLISYIKLHLINILKLHFIPHTPGIQWNLSTTGPICTNPTCLKQPPVCSGQKVTIRDVVALYG